MIEQDEALMLIEAITQAFRHGTLHYDQHGKLLCSVEEVLIALLDGPVRLEDWTRPEPAGILGAL